MSLNIGTSLITLSSSWAEIKAVVARDSIALRSREKGSELHLFAIDDPIVYLCTLYRGEVPHAIAEARNPGSPETSQAENDADLADFDANHAATSNRAVTKRSASGTPASETSPRTGSKLQIISQNFCDKHTWYSTSARRTAQAMTDTGDGLTFALAADKVGVDVTHGRIIHERKIRATYKPVVKVDAVTKTEVDPHSNAGDYTIDYATMRVTFTTSQAGKAVTLDFSEVINSKWYLKPATGKKLRLISAELQFSTNARMEDTFLFQARGDVAKFTALAGYWNANGGPYPAGTMLPIGDPTCYQTVFDLICEANLSYPIINALKHETPTWRDTVSDIMIFSWDYGDQATVDVSDGPGWDPNDIEISLEHDQEMTGACAVVTFYCLSEDL